MTALLYWSPQEFVSVGFILQESRYPLANHKAKPYQSPKFFVLPNDFSSILMA